MTMTETERAEHQAHLEGRADDQRDVEDYERRHRPALHASQFIAIAVQSRDQVKQLEAALDSERRRRSYVEGQLTSRAQQVASLHEDIGIMNKSMNAAARENGLCEKFDEWVDDINGELSAFQLSRSQTFTFHIAFDLDITLQAGIDPSTVRSELETYFYHRLDGDAWVQKNINEDCDNVEAGHPTIDYEEN